MVGDESWKAWLSSESDSDRAALVVWRLLGMMIRTGQPVAAHCHLAQALPLTHG